MLDGECSTRVTRRGGRIVVTLTEVWAWRTFHYAGSPDRPQHHTWSFAFRPTGGVRSIGSSGDFLPQWVM
jgi:hypothetical protein